MKNFLMNSLSVTAAAIMVFFLPACGENRDISDTDGETEAITVESLFDLELTEREIAFVEDLTEKEFETLTEKDLEIYKTISVVGDNVLFGRFLSSGIYSYYIDNNKHEIGHDYSDCVYLLQYFPNLKNITLSFQIGLTDVSFLKNIPNLEALYIDGCKINDLSVLENHTNLKSLEIIKSPVTKIKLHNNAKLEQIILEGTIFDDMSVFENQINISVFAVRESLVPLINTQIFSKFETLNTLSLIAPQCDYSFFEDMVVAPPNLEIGGFDNIDLSPLKYLIYDIHSFTLYYSNGTDLTLLDNMPDDGSRITLNSANPGVRGEKTKEESEILKVQDIEPRYYKYYELFYSEFLPDEFK